MLVGTDVWFCVVFVLGVSNRSTPEKNPPARLGDHVTISHVTPGVVSWLQWWEAKALLLRQSESGFGRKVKVMQTI